MPLSARRFAGSLRLQKAAMNMPAMTSGETNPGVSLLQQALIDLGWEMPRSTRNGEAAPDGMFGSETRTCLIAFQKQHQLSPDAIAGKQTFGKLDELFRTSDPHTISAIDEQMACMRDIGPTSARSKYGATTARRNGA